MTLLEELVTASEERAARLCPAPDSLLAQAEAEDYAKILAGVAAKATSTPTKEP